MEIWNLVFIQDQVDHELQVIGPFPAKNVDTGSSLERVAMVLQGVENVFETDLLRPMLEVAETLSGRTHGNDPLDDLSLKVIAEHGRATTFLIADGVQPSNEGRGYILRRMLRRVGLARAAPGDRARRDRSDHRRRGRAFGGRVSGAQAERGVHPAGGGVRGGALRRDAPPGTGAVRGREGAAPTEGRVSGDDAFKLSDTFGFPLQLTEELAAEAGLTVDSGSVRRAARGAAEPRPRRREEGPDRSGRGRGPPVDVRRLRHTRGRRHDRVVARSRSSASCTRPRRARRSGSSSTARRSTPRAEDRSAIEGLIRTPSGVIRVIDTVPAGDRSIVHTGRRRVGRGAGGDEEAHAEVDAERREATARAHTSTHVVHATLRELLGDHARQAGSLVEPGRLRFDFPHPSAVSPDQLQEAELIANRRLSRDDEPQHLRDLDGGGQAARCRDALRREVRRHGPRRRARRLLARALRRDARREDRAHRSDPAPARRLDRRRACGGSRPWSVPTPSARSTPSERSSTISWTRSVARTRARRWSTPGR